MSVAIVIPSRIGSTRLPRKAVIDICGKPMIQHVYERCLASQVGDVFVATDSEEIRDIIKSINGKAIMTDPNLPSGTDRVHAAIMEVDPDEQKYQVIVNVQDDLPNVHHSTITSVASLMLNSGVDITTPVFETKDRARINLSNCVKVALARKGPSYGKALYFSRAAIPYSASTDTFFEHIGIYAYRRDALQKFVATPPSDLEKRESLEQLRALESDMTIYAAITNHCPVSVDIFDDLMRAREAILSKL